MIEPREQPSLKSPPRRRGAGARAALIAALALLSPAGCGSRDVEPDDGHRLDVGMNGRIEFAVESTEPIKRGFNTFHVRLTWTDSRDPVQRIKLRVYASMTSMGHGSAHEGAEIEPGVYEVADVPFGMGGLWDVQCRVLTSSLIDEAAFEFDVH
ncbi:FixH family protein [Sorangium sp. So ce726]|uniref:FixH family protein n=1 Tax=Sorangium sp. So ce726 TaxID=3133319 RepID=UPI003F5DB4D7